MGLTLNEALDMPLRQLEDLIAIGQIKEDGFDYKPSNAQELVMIFGGD